MDPTTDLQPIQRPCGESLDLNDLFALYQPYSRDWLNRLRRGEIDFSPPLRLTRLTPRHEGDVPARAALRAT